MGTMWRTELGDRRALIDAKTPAYPVEGIPPTTLSSKLLELARDDPNERIFVDHLGEPYSRERVVDMATKFAKSAIKLGLQPRDAVCVMGFNSIEWAVADFGAILAGGVSVGIYSSSSSEACRYLMEHSGAVVVVVESEYLQTILNARLSCPKIKAVVYWGGDAPGQDDHAGKTVISFEEFLRMGDGLAPSEIQGRIEQQRPEDCCSIVYTSGTTGHPKGVMISHDNVVWTVEVMRRLASLSEGDVLISFLPLSHVAANHIDLKGAVIIGYTVHFAARDALQGSLGRTMKDVRPTVFLAVPRVWEKIQEKMQAVGQEAGLLARVVGNWAKRIGRDGLDCEDAGGTPGVSFSLADWLVFRAVKQRLGLDRCRYLVSSAAPSTAGTMNYFRSLNMRICDLYGASEASGPMTVTRPWHYKLGTSGAPIPGLDLKIEKPDGAGEGEVCVRGRNVFIGYLGDAEGSAQAIDEEGFYHTGDLGTVDADGFLRVSGRLKELIVTSGGENVAPVPIEGRIVESVAGVVRAVVVGDRRRFLSCLLALETESTESEALAGRAAVVDPAARTVGDARASAAWARHIEGGLARANAQAVSRAAHVRKYVVLAQDLSVAGGELTETLKVRRSVVAAKFADQVAALYAGC